jgi:hypothetical protein
MSQSKTIIAAAAACFAQHKAIQELYVTEDGNAFMPHVQGLAVNHARMNRLPEPVLVKRDDPGVVEAIAMASKGRKTADEHAAAAPAPEAGAEAAESTAMTEGGEGAEAPAPEALAEDKGKKRKK